jgi:hypothetical protein
MDASTESLPIESLTGHEDFFAAESPYALPLLSAAAVVRFSKKAFRFFRVARWFSRNLAMRMYAHILMNVIRFGCRMYPSFWACRCLPPQATLLPRMK